VSNNVNRKLPEGSRSQGVALISARYQVHSSHCPSLFYQGVPYSSDSQPLFLPAAPSAPRNELTRPSMDNRKFTTGERSRNHGWPRRRSHGNRGASRRLIRLWFEMHYFAHLLVCRIGRIQPRDPLLPTFYVSKESPVSRTTTVADPVEVGGGQDFQSGGRGVLLDAIELGQIIAITDLCDDLTGFRAFLVNKVQTNEVGWLMVFGFGHELRHSMCWFASQFKCTLCRRPKLSKGPGHLQQYLLITICRLPSTSLHRSL